MHISIQNDEASLYIDCVRIQTVQMTAFDVNTLGYMTIAKSRTSKHNTPKVWLSIELIKCILFYLRSEILYSYGGVTIASKRLQNVGLSSLSCHSCCDTGPRFFWSHSTDHPNLVVFYDKQEVLRTSSRPAGLITGMIVHLNDSLYIQYTRIWKRRKLK